MPDDTQRLPFLVIQFYGVRIKSAEEPLAYVADTLTTHQ